MNWKRFNLANNLLGWISFLIATTVYLLTMESTASLWDCAEFVACDYSLEVGHPPGAPFYMLVYNVISHFAPTAHEAGLYANAASAIISGLCILFLFWTITSIVRRLIKPEFNHTNKDRESLGLGQAIAVLGSGLVGALVYTFSDTFWFSAVEAEVYAFSSLFTAVVFWLMLKWEERSEETGSDRWIILLAYLMGLSIGVHLLNLLCLPAMALVYYYKRAESPNIKGSILALLASFGLIILMMYGIVQGVPKMAGYFDYVFVNTLGLSFNTGLFFYLALVVAILVWSVYNGHRALQTNSAVSFGLRLSIALSVILLGIPLLGGSTWGSVLLSLAVLIGVYYIPLGKHLRLVYVTQMSLLAIVIGFSSYGVILVRAIADTPMNENAPANAFSLRYYLAREQYGSTPLFYGPSFAARPTGIKEDAKELLSKAPKTEADSSDRYMSQTQPEYEYNPEDMMLFPRLYSAQHAPQYNSWIGREPGDMSKPTMMENLTYFMRYQVGYMYWRYFMWNFSGRQNDLQGDGGLLKGNAITGISFIDQMIIGPTENMPDDLATNKGRNVYYMLPLLLGLLGIFYQLTRSQVKNSKNKDANESLNFSMNNIKDKQPMDIGQQSFWITFFLFFMTGLAILFYLNQTPGQPRERDYAYAGSFYAFSIWVGIGVAGLWRILSKAKLSDTLAAAVATLLALFIPLQMAGENWDDHDRSGRTIARDMGINYLESCEPNAILFCYGDNDTFPLWYIQDVEGVRRDIRTVNLSYLGGDWYIDQMQRTTYDGKPLPLSYMTPSFYYTNEVAYINTQNTYPMELGEALQATIRTANGSEVIFPTTSVVLPVDSAHVATKLSKTRPALVSHVLPELPISFGSKRYLDRGALTALDMIKTNNWERPIYWAITSPSNLFDNLREYQIQTGMANQLLPLVAEEAGRMNIDRTYDLVMNKFRYGGAENPKVYMDETARNMMGGMRNQVFIPLAKGLLARGDKEKAKQVLKKCLTSIRAEVVPYDAYSLFLAEVLYEVEMTAEADKIVETVGSSNIKSLDWYFQLSPEAFSNVLQHQDLQNAYEAVTTAFAIAKKYNRNVLDVHLGKMEKYHQMISQLFSSRAENNLAPKSIAISRG